MRVTVLGCGGSSGVPTVSGGWGHCDPADPRNRRRRPSVLVDGEGAVVLVDTSPDLREQLLSAAVRHIDAVVYTHGHADHVHGIDELREVNRVMGRGIDIHADDETLAELTGRFGYCFETLRANGHFYKPLLFAHRLDGPFMVGGLGVVPFAQDHGFSRSIGYRFGRFAYSTDVVRLDETALQVLEGIDTWVVDCMRLEPHPVHADLETVLGWVARVKPRRTVLTHMGTSLDYMELSRRLPAGMEPGYDGLVLEIPDS